MAKSTKFVKVLSMHQNVVLLICISITGNSNELATYISYMIILLCNVLSMYIHTLSLLNLDMMLQFILLWAMMYYLSEATATHGYIIKVDPVNGKDYQACQTNPTVTYKSLDYALKCVIYNDTIVQLPTGFINLSLPITIFNHSNISIVGNVTTSTTLQCNSSKAGLYFVATSFTIANLTITNCSMLQTSTTWNDSTPAVQVQYPSAVTIYNSFNIVIQNVSFSRNNGIGLSIINTGGSVTINESTFDSNYITDGDYPGGGGMYIEFPFFHPDKTWNYVNYSLKTHIMLLMPVTLAGILPGE